MFSTVVLFTVKLTDFFRQFQLQCIVDLIDLVRQCYIALNSQTFSKELQMTEQKSTMPTLSFSQSTVGLLHRNEEFLSRREMDTKGGQSVGATGPVQQPDCVGVELRGRGAGPVLPWRTLRTPPFPTPGQAWGTYVVCGFTAGPVQQPEQTR